jgi:hypothetical protein
MEVWAGLGPKFFGRSGIFLKNFLGKFSGIIFGPGKIILKNSGARVIAEMRLAGRSGNFFDEGSGESGKKI